MSVTIVTQYYSLPNNKKRSLEEFHTWIHYFLEYCNNPIVMFSDGEEANEMDAYRKRLHSELASKWLLIRRPFKELSFTSPDWMKYWNEMLEKNICKQVYLPEIFILYANKTKLLKEVITLNPFKTSHFFWCDAGCWRNKEFTEKYLPFWPAKLPNSFIISWVGNVEIYKKYSNEILFQTNPIYNQVTVGGAIFGGPAVNCVVFSEVFESLLYQYRENHVYGVDDQCILATASILLERLGYVENILPPDPPAGGDIWFALQYILAKQSS